MSRLHKIPPVMVLAVIVYTVAVGCLLFTTIFQPMMQQAEVVKVSITDFQPPELREMLPEQKQQLAEIEKSAREIRNQAAVAVDVAAERENIRHTVENLDMPTNAGQPDSATLSTSALPSDSAVGVPSAAEQAENVAMLASLEGIGPVELPSGGGGKGGASSVGPPGMIRGASGRLRLEGSFRRKAVEQHGGNKRTEEAVDKALAYLASKQNKDGSWGGQAAAQTGDIVALTGLSVLSFLGRGEHYESKYGDNVFRGIDYLLLAADVKGVERVGKGFGHAILTYALAEAYTITGDIRIKPVLEARVAAMIHNQNSLGSFSVDYDNAPVAAEPSQAALAEMNDSQRRAALQVIAGEPTCDLSLLGWHLQALTAAKVAGVKNDGLDEALRTAGTALIGVHQAKSGGFSQGINAKRFDRDDTLTPVGMLGMQLLGHGNSKAVGRARATMMDKKGKMTLPQWDAANNNAFPLYRWYYQTQAIFQTCGGKGSLWNTWNTNLKHELTVKQAQDGSWKICGGDTFRLKDEADLTTYSTAMAALMLEVYYRYLPGYSVREAPRGQESLEERLDTAKLGLLEKMSEGIDPDAALLLGAGIRKIDPIYFGRFDGKPSQPADPQVLSEFKTYASMASTIGVRKSGDIPQLLQPNQRVAFFLDELLPEGFKWHLLLHLAISYDEKMENQYFVPLEVVINGQTIFKSYLHSPHQLVSVLIPADTLNAFGNVLEVRNSGNIPLCFDAAKLESVGGAGRKLFLAAEDADKLPKDVRYVFNVGAVALPNAQKLQAVPQSQLRQSQFYKAESESLSVRRSSSWMVKENLKTLGKISPEWGKLLREATLRICSLMQNKTEPMIELVGVDDAEKIRPAAAIYGPFVKYWQIEGPQAKEAAAILREYCRDAYVMANCDRVPSKMFCEPPFCEYRQPLYQMLKLGQYDTDGLYWGQWDADGSEEMGQKFQRYYLCKEGRGVTEWISGGGCGVLWGKILNGGKFYDSLYHTPLPALAALRQVGRLFEGAPQFLPSGFYPKSGEDPLLYASSAAALNAPEIATVIAARRFPIYREMEVLAVVPWSGETLVTVEMGYLPQKSPYAGMAGVLTKKTETFVIKDNLFRYKGAWPEMVVFRLVKKGTRDISDDAPKIEWAKADNTTLDIDMQAAKRDIPSPDSLKITARNVEGFTSTTGPGSEITTIPATLNVMAGDNSVYPTEAKSVLVTFRFGKQNSQKSDNVFMALGNRPKDSKVISFRVYPRIVVKKKTKDNSEAIPFRFAIGSKIIQIQLRLEQWNQVTIPLEKLDGIYGSAMRIMTPPRGDCESVVYEINDMAYCGPSGISFYEIKISDGNRQTQIVILGKPGTYGEFRYKPKSGFRIKDVKADGLKNIALPDLHPEDSVELGSRFLPKDSVPKTDKTKKPAKGKTAAKKQPAPENTATINTASGELELKLHFPTENSTYLSTDNLKQLSGKAKYELTKSNPIPVVVTVIQELEQHVQPK